MNGFTPNMNMGMGMPMNANMNMNSNRNMMSNSGAGGAQHNSPSRIVYLGSIPYDQTEEQILDLCNNVGPVINLKMMFDPQTGKSKGYAFIEFKDLETSASAIRNLNGYQLGSRFLKCGYSSNNDISASSSGNVHEGNILDNDGSYENNSKMGTFSDLPSGVDVNINMTTPAMMITSELSKKSKSEKLKILKTFQEWSSQNNDLAVQLFDEYPQLSFAVAELLLTNGICKLDDLTQLVVSEENDDKERDVHNTDSITNKQNDLLSDDPELQKTQRELLRKVLQLSDSEISILPDDEKMSLWDLKQRALKGEFGNI
ncbi:hypothetical protein NCAS_0A05830 [Naumovozyma castellii]|uniref:RRM domain-containing protein n=1 Tax=Naumovozyma castellii TaxID=27288 RepID=G0V6P5_NAUCA|nr:hypothetical protein NCAS_0A05830 [Naumovozyma castellii CBS 4309]CCC67141.1 hypothetical protein NCAS_0A05830 [Naumovozyma castellii CBS 4309]